MNVDTTKNASFEGSFESAPDELLKNRLIDGSRRTTNHFSEENQ